MLFKFRTTAPAQTREQQLKSKALGLIVGGAMVLLIGIGLFCSLLTPPAVPIDMSEITAAELAKDNVYRIEELRVGDYYAEYGETQRFTGEMLSVEKEYYTAFLTDSTGELYVASLIVEANDDIKPAVDAYMADMDIPLGDLAVSGYFKASVPSGQLLEYYEEATTWYEDTDVDFPICRINLDYECSLDTDYTEYAEKVAWEGRIVALVFIGLGLLLGIWGIAAHKNLKKRIAEQAAKIAAETAETEE